jgi:hypothetical protein
MVNGLGEMELELESLGEFEGEFESELEGELESELEGELESELEGEFESEFETEFESEFELEGEFEGEGPNPVNRVYPDAMMEHLGRAAMEAESEFEAAEHFLPLIPLVASKLLPIAAKALPKIAGKVLPRVARAITRVTPRMTRSVGNLTRILHRNPRTRRLVRVIPSVARRAVTTIAKQVAAGHPVSPQKAARILAHEKRRVLGNPQIVRSVLRRSRMMDQRFHRFGGFGYRPGGHPYRIGGYPYRVGGYPYRVGGAPARVTHAHPRVAGWGVGGRARFCPTCGATRMQGVRRVCCCC